MRNGKPDQRFSGQFEESVQETLELMFKVFPWMDKVDMFISRGIICGIQDTGKRPGLIMRFLISLPRIALFLIIYISLMIISLIKTLSLMLIIFLRSPFIRDSITEAPGTRLLALVDFLFAPAAVENTFRPLVSDWRYEYFDALKQGRTWKARWISLRYRCAFIWSMSLSKLFSFLKQLRSATK